MYKKKTLRHMQPVTRRYARILNDLDGVLRRLRNLTEEVARLETDSRALYNRQKHEEALERSTSLDNHMDKCRAEYLAEPDEEDATAWEKVSTTHVVLDPKTGECETTTEVHHEQVHCSARRQPSPPC